MTIGNIPVKIVGDYIPEVGTQYAACYDLYAVGDIRLEGQYSSYNLEYWRSLQYIEYKTSIKLESAFENCSFRIYPRSSISKTNLILCNSVAVIDNDYRGEILLRFRYIFQPEDMVVERNKIYGKINFDAIYKTGDKIAQICAVEDLSVHWKKARVEDLGSTA